MIERRRRPRLSFASVNRPGSRGFRADYQRHHLLPLQLLSTGSLTSMIAHLGRGRIGFDDFRSNGMLLPASEALAAETGFPLHRGPHHDYNRVVIARVGRIEEAWSRARLRQPDYAHMQALMQLSLLQRTLRRRMLQPGQRAIALNRRDPALRSDGFEGLDAMADTLWQDFELLPAPGQSMSESALAAS